MIPRTVDGGRVLAALMLVVGVIFALLVSGALLFLAVLAREIPAPASPDAPALEVTR